MGILRTIIWVLLTAVLVIFAMANWLAVTVTIWPGQVLDTKLPVLILASFLIGSVAMWTALRTTRLREQMGEQTRIDVQFVDLIPLVRTGKRQAVISRLSLDFQTLPSPESPFKS